MGKNLLIIGAGPGLSSATARRFGSQGFHVHLVGRNEERLEAIRATHEASGIVTTTHAGDVTQHDAFTKLLTEIDDQHALDACIFQPGGRGSDVVDVFEANVANTRPNLELLVLGAIAVGETLVPRMRGRNAGTLVFVGGGSARLPLRAFGNLGPAMAGLRAYALTLEAALRDSPLHAAFFTVAGMIAEGDVGADQIDPDALAERLWTLVDQHDAREVLMTAGGEVVPKGSR